MSKLSPLRVFACGFLIVTAAAAIAPELWAPASYETQFRESVDAPPSARFPLGTDALGRDRFSRLLYGTRVSLLLAPAAALLTCLEAAFLGAVAGLAGRWADRLIESSADLFLSLPWLFLLLTVRACLPLNISPMASVTITFLLLGALGWAAPARVVRAAVQRLKQSDFLLQARATGSSPWRLLVRHLIPNLMPVLLAQFWVSVPVYILAEATLGMLGLGVTEPLPSWGSMLRELETASAFSQPWQLAPAILLAALIGCFQLILPREDYSV
ncbi:MAG TPA: ABC transporter permease [Bryobacteraceae bacterium]|nr:ABC transporter permease [Bryobacteraceae bacterium]